MPTSKAIRTRRTSTPHSPFHQDKIDSMFRIVYPLNLCRQFCSVCCYFDFLFIFSFFFYFVTLHFVCCFCCEPAHTQHTYNEKITYTTK